MNKLIAAHLMRLKKDKCFWICTLFTIFIAVYRNLDSYSMSKEYNYTCTLESVFFPFVMLMAMLSPVFCSLFLGTEFSDGTIRNKLTVGHDRISIYLSDLIVCSITNILLCIAYIIPCLCLGIPLFGFFTFSLQMILIQMGCSLILAIAYAALYTAVAMLNQNRAVTAVICIMGMFLLFFFGTLLYSRLNEPETYGSYTIMTEAGEVIQEEASPNPFYVGGARRAIYEFLVEALPSGQTAMLSSPESPLYGTDTEKPPRLILYSSMISLLSTGLGIYFFRKKDIK